MLRERSQRVTCKEVSSFHATSGRERPAGTALALVLDGGDGSLGDPINGGRGGVNRLTVDTGSRVTAKRRGAGAEADSITPLRDGHVRELIKSHLEGLGLVGIMGLDLLNHLDEDLKALDELLAVLELELILLHVVNEHGLVCNVQKMKERRYELKEERKKKG